MVNLHFLISKSIGVLRNILISHTLPRPPTSSGHSKVYSNLFKYICHCSDILSVPLKFERIPQKRTNNKNLLRNHSHNNKLYQEYSSSPPFSPIQNTKIMANARNHLNMNQPIEENYIIDYSNYPYTHCLVYHRFVGKSCCKVVLYNEATQKHDYIGCISFVESKGSFKTNSKYTAYNNLPIQIDPQFKPEKLGVILDKVEGKNNDDNNNGSSSWFSWFRPSP